MNADEFIENVWNNVPAEARLRIEKLAASEKKSLADEVLVLLSGGVSTLAPFFMSAGY